MHPRAASRIDLIGAPIDLGVKELGLKLGPDSFRQAGLLDILQQQGFDARDVGNILPPDANHSRLTDADRVEITAAFCERLAQRVRSSIADQRLPVTLGGDHSLAIGSIAGAASATGNLGCIWIDAHPDANTPESSASGNIHGMPVAVSLGHGDPALVNVARQGRKIKPQNLAILGASDIDPPEQELIDNEGAAMFTIFDFVRHGLAHAVDHAIERATHNTAGVHVSLDLDALHADIAPGVGITSDFGLSLREAMFLCREIARRCNVVSIDLVSLNPVRDLHFQTAHRGIELLCALLGKTYSFNYAAYLAEQQQAMRY